MGIKPMLQEFPQEGEARGGYPVTYGCHSCCFYREGEKRPIAGMTGCHFISGKWSQIDAILLAKSILLGNTGDPNYTEPGSGFSSNGRKIAKKDTFAIDDFFGKPINHIPGKGSLARPGYRKAPAARIAGERAEAAFFAFKTQLYEV